MELNPILIIRPILIPGVKNHLLPGSGWEKGSRELAVVLVVLEHQPWEGLGGCRAPTPRLEIGGTPGLAVMALVYCSGPCLPTSCCVVWFHGFFACLEMP